MFNLFKKNNEEVIDCDCDEHYVISRTSEYDYGKKDIIVDGKLVIPVNDVTHYLVQEFETQDRLKEEINSLKDRFDREREKTNKYNASLVLIEEYKKRINEYKVNIDALKDVLENKKNLYNEALAELEIYKVERIKKLEDYNEAKRAAKIELIKSVVIELEKCKGNLSKQKFLKIINEQKPSL